MTEYMVSRKQIIIQFIIATPHHTTTQIHKQHNQPAKSAMRSGMIARELHNVWLVEKVVWHSVSSTLQQQKTYKKKTIALTFVIVIHSVLHVRIRIKTRNYHRICTWFSNDILSLLLTALVRTCDDAIQFNSIVSSVCILNPKLHENIVTAVWQWHTYVSSVLPFTVKKF